MLTTAIAGFFLLTASAALFSIASSVTSYLPYVKQLRLSITGSTPDSFVSWALYDTASYYAGRQAVDAIEAIRGALPTKQASPSRRSMRQPARLAA